MRLPAALLLVLAAVSPLACSDDEESGGPCTVAGCRYEVDYQVKLPGTLEQIRTYTFGVCHNDHCVQGTVINDRVELAPGSDTDALGEGFFMDFLENGPSYLLFVKWGRGDTNADDGDQLTVHVTDAAGQPVIDDRRTLSYESYYPNHTVIHGEISSETCGMLCYRAKLD